MAVTGGNVVRAVRSGRRSVTMTGSAAITAGRLVEITGNRTVGTPAPPRSRSSASRSRTTTASQRPATRSRRDRRRLEPHRDRRDRRGRPGDRRRERPGLVARRRRRRDAHGHQQRPRHRRDRPRGDLERPTRARPPRRLAANQMPTYPQASPAISVQALLKQPQRISRDLANLVYQRLITPKLFVRGTPEQVAGGAMQYQLAESIFLDTTQDVEEIATRGDWPRVGWTEALKTAAGQAVRARGAALEPRDPPQRDRPVHPRRAEAREQHRPVRRHAGDRAADRPTRASRRRPSAAAWTIAGTDIIAEIAKAQESIETKNNGYNGFDGAVLVLNIARRDDLLNNTVLRAALPREARDGQIQTGMMAPFLGLGRSSSRRRSPPTRRSSSTRPSRHDRRTRSPIRPRASSATTRARTSRRSTSRSTRRTGRRTRSSPAASGPRWRSPTRAQSRSSRESDRGEDRQALQRYRRRGRSARHLQLARRSARPDSPRNDAVKGDKVTVSAEEFDRAQARAPAGSREAWLADEAKVATGDQPADEEPPLTKPDGDPVEESSAQ
jgi:hypothetical protein